MSKSVAEIWNGVYAPIVPVPVPEHSSRRTGTTPACYSTFAEAFCILTWERPAHKGAPLGTLCGAERFPSFSYRGYFGTILSFFTHAFEKRGRLSGSGRRE